MSVQIPGDQVDALIRKAKAEGPSARETKALLGWSNQFLKQRSLVAGSLEDFADGVLLINLLEVGFGERLRGKYKHAPKLPIQKLENVSLAFDFMDARHVLLLSIDSHHIVAKKQKKIIQLLYNIMRSLLSRGFKRTGGASGVAGSGVRVGDWNAKQVHAWAVSVLHDPAQAAALKSTTGVEVAAIRGAEGFTKLGVSPDSAKRLYASLAAFRDTVVSEWTVDQATHWAALVLADTMPVEESTKWITSNKIDGLALEKLHAAQEVSALHLPAAAANQVFAELQSIRKVRLADATVDGVAAWAAAVVKDPAVPVSDYIHDARVDGKKLMILASKNAEAFSDAVPNLLAKHSQALFAAAQLIKKSVREWSPVEVEQWGALSAVLSVEEAQQLAEKKIDGPQLCQVTDAPGLMTLGVSEDTAKKLAGSLKRLYNVGRGDDAASAVSMRKNLLDWCRHVFADNPAIVVQDFWASFQDGRALCAIVDKLVPNSGIPVAALKPANAKENLETAFRVAEDKLGIPSLLQAEDLLKDFPADETSVMNYISMLLSAASVGASKNEELMRVKEEVKASKENLEAEKEKLKKQAEVVKEAERQRFQDMQEKLKHEAETAKIELQKQIEAEKALQEHHRQQAELEREKLEALRRQQDEERKQREELRKQAEEERAARQREREEQARQAEEARQAQLAEEAKLKSEHEGSLAQLRTQLTADKQQTVAQLKKDNEAAAQQLKAGFDSDLAWTRKEHESNVTLLKAEHQAALKSEHNRYETLLSQFKQKEIALQQSTQREVGLKIELEESRMENEELEQKMADSDARAAQEIQELNAEVYKTFRENAELVGRVREDQNKEHTDQKMAHPAKVTNRTNRDMSDRLNDAIRSQKKDLDFLKQMKNKEGYLLRRRPNAVFHKERFKPLYFCLTEEEMQYFNTKEDKTAGKNPKGSFKMGEYKLGRAVSTTPGSFTFRLDPLSNKEDGSNIVVELKSQIEVPDMEDKDIKEWLYEINRRVAIKQYMTSVAKGSQAGNRELLDFVTDSKQETLRIEDRLGGLHDALVSLSGALFTRPNLKSLMFRNTALPDATIEIIAEIIKENNNIRTVVLSDNLITEKSAAALTQALFVNSSVTHLDLANNALKDAGVSKIAEMLPGHPALRELHLTGNAITDKGLIAVITALEASQKKHGQPHPFTMFSLEYNLIADEACHVLADFIQRNPTVQHLYFSHNLITDDGVMALTKALSSHKTGVESLTLASNQLSSKGVFALAHALKDTRRDLTVDISDNRLVTKQGFAALVKDDTDLDYLLFKVRRKMMTAEEEKRMQDMHDKTGRGRDASSAAASPPYSPRTSNAAPPATAHVAPPAMTSALRIHTAPPAK